MRAVIYRFHQSISSFHAWIGKTVSWSVLLLIAVVCIDVVRRYLLRSTSTWIIEAEWYIYSVLFLLAAAYTHVQDRHVRVDLFYDKLTELDRSRINLVGHLVFLLPWSLVMTILCSRYAWSSFLLREGSPNPDGIPVLYLLKAVLAICFFTLLLQSIADILRHVADVARTWKS